MKSPQQSAGIPFTKASACGNDFLIVDAAGVSGDLSAISRRLCDRHNGIGADGVEWLFPDAHADIRAQLFNADGSEAEVSGNGTRCVAAYLYAQQEQTGIIVLTGAGPKSCRLVGRQGAIFWFEADMGEPVVAGELAFETIGLRVVVTNGSMVK